MWALAASFTLLIAGQWIQTSSGTINVGDCNITYFISNGQQCQREMVTNLLTKPNTNCSYEYNHEKKCLRDHIATCLTSNMALHVTPVTSLLLHQIYHCGDLEYQPSQLNKLILTLIKCNQGAFMDTEFCWRYFRDRLNANRSDPLLCREYALAKECITEKAKANCQICDNLKRDTYNPFCPNKTDPVVRVNGCQDLMKPMHCTAHTAYKVAMECDKKFVTAFMGNEKPDCGAAETVLRKCLDDQLSRACQGYANNQRLQDDIEKAVTAVLRGRRFYCEPVSLRAIDLDIKVRPLFPCSAEFMPEMEKCALPIREEYNSQNVNSDQLCRKFKAAVNCSNFAQTSYCKFEKDVATIIQDSYESLCNTGSGKKAISGAASVSTGLSLTIFVVAVQLLRGSH